MILKDFNHKVGINCESNTMCDLLAYHGVKISEPMIIGICEGYSFVYLNLKAMGFPWVGGRIRILQKCILSQKIGGQNELIY